MLRLVENQETRFPVVRGCSQFLLCLMFFFFHTGCSREYFRTWADQDAEQLIRSKEDEVQWPIEFQSVDPHPESRMADFHDKDYGPRPADDPEVEDELFCPAGYDNRSYWSSIESGAAIENQSWIEFLPRNKDGQVEITQSTANGLALIHSRQYQTQVEQIYINALSLSENRFEFLTQWIGGTNTNFNATGEAPNATRNLSQVSNLGFSKNLAAGGQFVTSLVNSLSWELGGNNFSLGSGSLVFTLTQPLLRGAFRHVRLENLVQSERNFVYAIRDFAHFRREFYLSVTNSYLDLVAQTQAIKNQKSNLESLRISLSEQEEKAVRKLVSQIEVDQIYQEFQSARIGLLAREQSYQDSLDRFKFLLGLPARVEVKIDESILTPFQLTDPRLDTLMKKIERLRLDLAQYVPPEDEVPKILLDRAENEILKIQESITEVLPSLQKEYSRWSKRLKKGLRASALEEEELDFRKQQEIAKRAGDRLKRLEEDLRNFKEAYPKTRQQLREATTDEAWDILLSVLRKDCNELVNSAFILQTQVRLFLIELKPYDTTEREAVELALRQRLDLMNQRAQVNDSFRQIEIAADRLESDLDVTASAEIGTDPGRSNSFRFDSSANSYRLGLRFDGPLNRFNERNAYRVSQIQYQQSRRSYMELEDQITNQIRSDLRNLRINWLRFQISRQQLIAASRQVEQAQLNLQNIRARGAGAGVNSNLTRDLLQSLQGLLDAKDQIISSWIAYEVARIRISVDSENLFLDEQGQWINSDFNPGAPGPAESQGDNDSSAIIPLSSLINEGGR